MKWINEYLVRYKIINIEDLVGKEIYIVDEQEFEKYEKFIIDGIHYTNAQQWWFTTQGRGTVHEVSEIGETIFFKTEDVRMYQMLQGLKYAKCL